MVGEGIPSLDSSIGSDWESVASGRTCTYPGSSTIPQAIPPVSDTRSLTFELKVMPGKKRVFQIVGINTTGSCPTEDIGNLISRAHKGTLPEEIEGLYEVGRATADVVKTGTILISSNYDVSSAYNF